MLKILLIDFILSVSQIAIVQGEPPTILSYKFSYWLDKFIGIGWPCLLIALTGYLILSVIRKVRK